MVTGRALYSTLKPPMELKVSARPSWVLSRRPKFEQFMNWHSQDLAIDRVSMKMPIVIAFRHMGWIMCSVLCFCECCISARSTGQVPVSCGLVFMLITLFDRFRWTQKVPPF